MNFVFQNAFYCHVCHRSLCVISDEKPWPFFMGVPYTSTFRGSDPVHDFRNVERQLTQEKKKKHNEDALALAFPAMQRRPTLKWVCSILFYEEHALPQRNVFHFAIVCFEYVWIYNMKTMLISTLSKVAPHPRARSPVQSCTIQISTGISTAHDHIVFFRAESISGNLGRDLGDQNGRRRKIERITWVPKIKTITIMGIIFSRWRVSDVKTAALSLSGIFWPINCCDEGSISVK